MKIPFSPGEYMFVTGAIYFVVGMVDLFWYRFAPVEYIQMIWILVLALPTFVPMPWLMRHSPFWRK
jgi:hypothetical protein